MTAEPRPMAERLDALALERALDAAVANVTAHAEAINALNVFPVPDGDTGTNMALTLRAALEELRRAPRATAAEAMAAVAHGALMGARGTGGVITSQILRGWSNAAQGKDTLAGADLAQGFQEAAVLAYRSVSEPVEGTILTVLRAVAEATRQFASGPGAAPEVVLAAEEAARTAVAATPFQLPVLRENGVVDAGGQGFLVMLEGILCAVRGEPLPDGQACRA